MRNTGVCFTMLLFLACGQGEGPGDERSPGDGGSGDSRSPGMIVDSGSGEADAQLYTVCGEGPDTIICEFNMEVCRITSQGGSPTPECVALPEHCDSDDRLCDRCAGACEAPLDTCDDVPAMNTIRCL